MADDGILTGTDVRQKLLAGAVKLTDAVSCTLGTRQTRFSFLDSPMAEAHCCLLSRHDDDSMSTV